MDTFYVYDNDNNDNYRYEAILNLSHFYSIDADIFNDIGYGKDEKEAISNLVAKIKSTMRNISSIAKEIYQETAEPISNKFLTCNKYKKEWHTIVSEKHFELYHIDDIELFKFIIGNGETKIESLNNFLIAVRTVIDYNSLSSDDNSKLLMLEAAAESCLYLERNNMKKFFTDAGFNNYIE